MRVSCSNPAGSALGGEGGSGRCGLSRHPCRVRRALDSLAPWVGLLFLRLLIGWEFLESGLEKLGGENWFLTLVFRRPAHHRSPGSCPARPWDARRAPHPRSWQRPAR